SGIPDLVWCEFSTSDREPVETFAAEVRKRYPDARFAFNWSSSFKWYLDPEPLTFAQLGDLGFKFIFITLGGQHAEGYGLSTLLAAMAEREEQGYIELQRREFEEGADIPTRSHHEFSGVIEGVAESAAAVLKLGGGVISDRIERRRLLIGIGYGSSVVAKALYLVASSWPIVLGARVGDRMGKGIRTAPRDALIADSTP